MRLLPWLLLVSIAWAQSVEDYSRQAEQMAKDRQPLEAALLLQRGLGQHPENPTLLRQYASLLLELGDARRAADVLRRSLLLEPSDDELRRMLGEAFLMQGELSRAQDLFEQVVEGAEAPASAHRNLAYSLLLQGDEIGALEQARRAVDKAPGNASQRRFYAHILDLRGRQAEALRQLKLAFRLAPEDARLLFHIGMRHKAAGNWGGALEFVEMASGIDGENPVYHHELAFFYDRMGLTREAIRHANLSRRLEEAFRDFKRALQIARQGREGEAIAFLEETLEGLPEFVSGRLYLARLYQKRGRKERALELYGEVLKREPSHRVAREQSAWLNMQSGATQAALQLLRDSKQQSPNRSFFEGYQMLLDENWDGALAIFRDLQQRYPLNSDLLQLISYALQSKGSRGEAAQVLDRASLLAPDSEEIRRQAREIRFQEGLEAMQSGRLEESAQVFERLAAEPEPEADYFLRAAYSRQNMGHLEEAIRLYRSGLRMRPGADWARLNLATSLYLRMRYKESAREWERLIEKKPTAQAYFQLGMCYSHMSRLAEAESAFTRSRRMGKESAELLYNLGLTRFRLGRQHEGLALIRAAAREGYAPASQFNRRVGRRLDR